MKGNGVVRGRAACHISSLLRTKNSHPTTGKYPVQPNRFGIACQHVFCDRTALVNTALREQGAWALKLMIALQATDDGLELCS